MFWPLGVLWGALSIYALLLVGGAIILTARRRRSDALNLSLAILLAASAVVTADGLAQLLSPLFSNVFGRDFTYQTTLLPFTPPQAPGAVAGSDTSAAQQERLRENVENQYRDDIVYGATMLVVGALVFGVLWLGRWFLRRWGAETEILGEAYLLLLLVTTTVVALAALVTAVAELVRRYLVTPVGPDALPPHPGAALATAIAFLPLWGWFLVRAIREAALHVPAKV
jgi:hypothetical protein